MTSWENPVEVMSRLMDALKTAEQCADRLAFLHEDTRWTQIGTAFHSMKDKVVTIATRRRPL